MNQFKLINDKLQQVPEREKPVKPFNYPYSDGNLDSNYEKGIAVYNAYIDSLPTYSLSKEMKEWCKKNPKDSYPESDFKLEEIAVDLDKGGRLELQAVPNKPDEKDEQDEPWGDAMDAISRMPAKRFTPKGIIELLKLKFHLSRISKND